MGGKFIQNLFALLACIGFILCVGSPNFDIIGNRALNGGNLSNLDVDSIHHNSASRSHESSIHSNVTDRRILFPWIKQETPFKLPTNASTSERIEFTLPSGEHLQAVRNVEQSNSQQGQLSSDLRLFVGDLTDLDTYKLGEIQMAFADDNLANAYLHLKDGRVFEITVDALGEQIIRELDQTAYPTCSESDEHERNFIDFKDSLTRNYWLRSADVNGSSSAIANGTSGTNNASSSTVDIMVVYSNTTANAIPSQSALDVLVANSVSSINTAFVNSKVDGKVRLVHEAAIDYNDSGDIDTDLTRLFIPDDGYMDEIASLREQYGADIVVMLSTSANFCGTSFVLREQNEVWRSTAFAAVNHNCAMGNLSFAHEVGHLFGASHDSSSVGEGLYPYSHGLLTKDWRTVMSYGSAPRILNFSNPLVSYDGVPTGKAENNAFAANNALTINQSLHFVASYLNAVVPEDTGTENVTTPSTESQLVTGDPDSNKVTTGSSAGQNQQSSASNPDLDSDGDGITDIQEELDATNALDSGSYKATLGQKVCSEWNGFLSPMPNIMEHINVGDNKLNVKTTLYNSSGQVESSTNFAVQRGKQVDLAIHDMTGWAQNQLGRVCSTHNGTEGSLDGGMVYYKWSESTISMAPEDIQFAFAMPFSNGVAGTQGVSFNTYQPSLAPEDSENLVANWLQISNLEDTKQAGFLRLYDISGKLLHEESLVLAPNSRQDYPAHQFGRNLVGLATWSAKNSSAKSKLQNIRYLYDNAHLNNSFSSAFQLEGAAGTGEHLAAVLDTSIGSAILEIMNISAEKVKVKLNLYDANGFSKDSTNISLAPHSSHHYIADNVLAGKLGLAVVKANTKNSIAAVAMHYGRYESGKVKYLYGIQAKAPQGSILRGSYNTYLGQKCRAILLNPTSENQTATLEMQRSDGSNIPLSNLSRNRSDVNIPARGALDIDICSNDGPNNYGVVTVTASTANAIIGTMLREGGIDHYRFPTPLR